MMQRNVEGTLRLASLSAVLAGAAGSVGMMLYAGRRNPSRFLLLLFAVWVLAPFVALVWAHVGSKSWPFLQRTTLYRLMLVVSLASLTIYGEVALGRFNVKTAFPFLAVPAASWLLIAIAAWVSARRSLRP
jgi:hypothetical protein